MAMQKFSSFLKRHIVWVSLGAVLLPLLILLSVQYQSSGMVQRRTAMARTLMFKNYIESINSDIRSFYQTKAFQILSIPEGDFGHAHLSRIERYLSHRNWQGAKQVFIASFVTNSTSQFLSYEPNSGVLQPIEDAAELRAISQAVTSWKSNHSAGAISDADELSVDQQDPAHRIIFKPVMNEGPQPTGLAGMILNSSFFKDQYLPETIRKASPRFFSPDYENEVIVTVRDADNNLALTSKPVTGFDEAVTEPLQFVFTDWRLGIENRSSSQQQWASQVFFTNLWLSVLMTLVLLGAVWLALRSASREMKLSQIKSDFVSNVSHELRTPLTSIKAFGELMKSGWVEDPKMIRDFGESIENESGRLTNLVNNILDFSRIESGKKAYRFEECNLDEIVIVTLKSLDGQLRQSRAHIDFATSPTPLPHASVDRDAIAQVIINLVDNALKYSADVKDIKVRLERHNEYLRLSVTDQGIGIDASDHERVFEKFYRVSTGLVHNVRGSGLGLALVKHIVDDHGGYITMNSQPGKGTTFSVFLPIVGRMLAKEDDKQRPEQFFKATSKEEG